MGVCDHIAEVLRLETAMEVVKGAVGLAFTGQALACEENMSITFRFSDMSLTMSIIDSTLLLDRLLIIAFPN